jgi:hypothetical protein
LSEILCFTGKLAKYDCSALLLTNWSRDLVLCTDGPARLSEDDRRQLTAQDISVREEPIARLEGRRASSSEQREGKQDMLERIVFTTGEKNR